MKNIKKVHHTGYLVSDINRSISAFCACGLQVQNDIFFDEDRKSNICFLTGPNGTVELISPEETSSLFPLLRKFRNIPYHICFEVQDIDQAIDELQEDGFFLFKRKQRAMAISDSAYVVFLKHSAIGIVELVQL